jgi:hypothetical protein
MNAPYRPRPIVASQAYVGKEHFQTLYTPQPHVARVHSRVIEQFQLPYRP